MSHTRLNMSIHCELWPPGKKATRVSVWLASFPCTCTCHTHRRKHKHKHTHWFHSLNNKNVEQSEFQLCFCTKLFTVFPLDVKLTISKQFIKCWRIFEHAVVFNRHRQSPCFVFTHNSMSYFNNEKDGALINPPNTGCQYISIAPWMISTI